MELNKRHIYYIRVSYLFVLLCNTEGNEAWYIVNNAVIMHEIYIFLAEYKSVFWVWAAQQHLHLTPQISVSTLNKTPNV